MPYEKPLPKPTHPPVDQGSITTFEYYRDLLIKRGAKPINNEEIQDGDSTCEDHLLWMCVHCIPRIRDDGLGYNVSKYSRWLGYIQGCLICKKITTVRKERNRTRNWFN